ncbi:hypothetical protein JVU11DRAFT_2002 [Chiua virens]|nr:hypothetical protein JVU11DRAFT_2002 [Chiua virens]
MARFPVRVNSAYRHLNQRATQNWLGLYTSCTIYADEAFFFFPSEIPQNYLFNDRLIDDLFRSIPSKLIVTSALNFVAANLLEYETTPMQSFYEEELGGEITDWISTDGIQT